MKLLHLTRKQNPNYTVLRYTPKYKDAEKLKVKCGENISENNRKKLAKPYLDQTKETK